MLRWTLLVIVAVMLVASYTACAGSGQQQQVQTDREALKLETAYLWNGPAPNAKGEGPEDRPRMYAIRPAARAANGAAVIVCPGGGYGIRGMDSEGVQVARWLNSNGVTAFILAYRVKGAGYNPDDSFTDASRAVRYLRHHAADYGVDPKRIGMLGFSAGGHLASRVALHSTPGDANSADAIEQESSRPDFLILCYTPAADTDWPKDGSKPVCPVTADTPPTFIFNTTSDESVSPDDMLLWYKGLRDAGVEVELHIFGGNGPHGMGLASGDPVTGRWPELAAAWMRRNNLLSGKERCAVQGMITIDGAPMYVGSITFLPIESQTDPIASGTVQGWVEMGRYRIPTKFGPVPGIYRVEVRHNAIAMMLTEPVMENEAVYHKSGPKADTFMTARITPGDNTVDIAITTK